MEDLSKPTQLDFVLLQVRNLEASKRFYHQTLHFPLVEYQNPEAVVFEDQQGAVFAIRQPLTNLPDSGPLGLGTSLWFSWSGAIEKLHRYLQQEGVEVVKPPFDTPFGKSIVVADPDGYLLTFHQADHA